MSESRIHLNPSNPTIRRANDNDASAINNVMAVARDVALPYLPTLYSHEQVESWIRDSVLRHCAVWVVAIDGAVVGFMALDGEELHHLYIHPDYRSQGYGAQLLGMAKEQSPTLRLYTFQKNTRARRFYEFHGFKLVALGDGSGNEEHEPDVLYRYTK